MKRIVFTLLLLILTIVASAQSRRVAMASPKVTEGNVSKFEVLTFTSELAKAMTNEGFRVVARGPAVDALIADFDFESSGTLTDINKAKLAQLSNADFLCMPEIMEKNGKYFLVATLIDKVNGEIIYVSNGYLHDFDDLIDTCQKMGKEVAFYGGYQMDRVECARLIEQNDADGIYLPYASNPEFPGGLEALVEYLSNNLKYPDEARTNGITGKVYLRFTVEKTGTIGDVIILKDIGGGCGEEAVRVVKSMPKWRPGMQNGKPVRVWYGLPITFNLK